MQICMKATPKQLADLKGQIAKAVAVSELTRSEISEKSQVHASQVSRICRGQFKTISHHVVQVCRELGIKLETPSTAATKEDASWSRLQASVRSIWDKTPEGAAKLVRVLDTIGQLKN